MMGHREVQKCGGEVDAVCRRARRLYGPVAGVLRYWKRQLSRRARRDQRRELRR